jgi:short subunit dehydrogenase-like uncharacterized protein
MTDMTITSLNRYFSTTEIHMNSSSNLLVLGVTGQVGKLVAENLRRREANFSVGTRKKANLEELADQFGASRFAPLARESNTPR